MLGRGERARLDHRGVARQHVSHNKTDQAHSEQRRHDKREPTQEIVQKAHLPGPADQPSFMLKYRSNVSQRFSMPTRSVRITRVQLSYQSIPQTPSLMRISWSFLTAAMRLVLSVSCMLSSISLSTWGFE